LVILGIANDKDYKSLSWNIKRARTFYHYALAAIEMALDLLPGLPHRLPGPDDPCNRNRTTPDKEVRVLALFSRAPLDPARTRSRRNFHSTQAGNFTKNATSNGRLAATAPRTDNRNNFHPASRRTT